jgi:dipeptidyl aminopeptidase/acylaminoacyl peptidase
VTNTEEFLFTGGFISFPSGTYQADPNGVIDDSPSNDAVTIARPVLQGTDPAFYDLALKRWLPVQPEQTSPDGGSYAYVVSGPSGSDPTQVHIVQVATGGDHTITLAPPWTGVGWQLEDFDGTSVFLTSQQVDQFPAGVWRLDIVTGSLHQLTQARHVLRVQNGTAWIGLVNPADPSPPTPGKGEAFDTIAAVNLATGAQTTWVYEPGKSVEVVAVDEFGRLVASIGPPPDFAPTSVVFYQSAGSVGDVVTGGASALFWVEPDRGRLWFGSDRGIYLWSSATGFLKVYGTQEQSSGGGQSIAPAGHCI